MMRLRISFAKTGAMRYTSHLDLHRAWERTLRRARLPLAYSQGFNPHPRINLASALPLGFTGSQEVIDVWLEEPLPVDEVREALRRAAPPGIQVEQVAEIEPRLPSLQSALEALEYTITFLEPAPDLKQRIAALLAQESLPRERRGKTYDLRPLILDLQPLPEDEDGRARCFARLAAQEGATGRPDEVIMALGEQPEAARVHRTALIFQDA